MSTTSCPHCSAQVTLPVGVRSETTVRCPLCHAHYSLADALVNMPPLLEVVENEDEALPAELFDAPASDEVGEPLVADALPASSDDDASEAETLEMGSLELDGLDFDAEEAPEETDAAGKETIADDLAMSTVESVGEPVAEPLDELEESLDFGEAEEEPGLGETMELGSTDEPVLDFGGEALAAEAEESDVDFGAETLEFGPAMDDEETPTVEGDLQFDLETAESAEPDMTLDFGGGLTTDESEAVSDEGDADRTLDFGEAMTADARDVFGDEGEVKFDLDDSADAGAETVQFDAPADDGIDFNFDAAATEAGGEGELRDFEDLQVDASGAAEDMPLDLPGEPVMAPVGAVEEEEPAGKKGKKKKEKKKKEKKPKAVAVDGEKPKRSLVGTLVSVVLPAVVAVPLALYGALWISKDYDFLGLGDFLPSAVLPAEYSKQPTQLAYNPPAPAAMTPAPVDESESTEPPAEEVPAEEMPADDAATEHVAGRPTDDAAEVPSEEMPADDSTTDAPSLAPADAEPAEAMADEPAPAESDDPFAPAPAEPEPAVAADDDPFAPAAAEPSAAAAPADDDPFAPAADAPEEMPAEDDPFAPAPADEPAGDDPFAPAPAETPADAPADDPFAPAPAEAPAGDDPFAPAPAEPAEMPADDDPFAPAPSEPAEAPADDPFAPAAAEPAAAPADDPFAPAPADEPAVDDPFAPAPAEPAEMPTEDDPFAPAPAEPADKPADADPFAPSPETPADKPAGDDPFAPAPEAPAEEMPAEEPITRPAADDPFAPAPAETPADEPTAPEPVEPEMTPTPPADADPFAPAPATTPPAEPALSEPLPVPAAAPETLGPRNVADVSMADISGAMQATFAAGQNLIAAESTADETQLKKARAAFYVNLFGMADAITSAQLGDAAAQLDPQLQALAPTLKQQLAADPKRLDALKVFGARWIGFPKRPTNGVVVSGTVESAEQVGKLFHTKARLGNTADAPLVTIVSAEQPDVAAGDTVLALGSIIDDPSQQIAGYEGTDPTVVWSGMAMKVTPSN